MKLFSMLFLCGFLAGGALAAPDKPAWTPQFATYLGGSESDFSGGIAVDASGNIYVAGATASPNFPGGEKLTDTTSSDAFLCKFSPSYQLLWTRFVGGIGFDRARGIALDKTGDVYLVGDSENGLDLLNVPRLPHGSPSAFVARFSAEGERQMTTQLGSNGATHGEAIIVDGEGNLWLAGTARGASFPATGEPLKPTGKTDVWVCKMAPSGELLFSTLVGGAEDEALGALIVAPGGGVALTGTTASTDFPLVNAQQTAFGGAGSRGDVKGDAWLARLDGEGKTRFASYFGGRGSDSGDALAFAPNGDLWLTGSSDSRDFALKGLLPDGDQAGGAFLARFKGDGSQLLQSTFVPDAPRRASFLSVEPNGEFWLGSDGGYSSGVFRLMHFDAAATKITATVPWNTDSVSVARAGDGAFYLTGAASFNLPTRRALMAASGGGYDAFVAVLKKQAPAAPNAAPATLSVDAPAAGLSASGATNIGDDGEVQVMLYRSADSTYWTGTDWKAAPTFLTARVTAGHWSLDGLPQGAALPPGDYYLHAVAVAGAQMADFSGAEYQSAGRAKTSRKIVVAP